MSFKEKLGTLTKTRGFMIIFGLVCLGLAYVFLSLAFDTGNLLDYAIAMLFTFVGVRELIGGLIKRNK